MCQPVILNEVTHILDSRMRETRTCGLEGGEPGNRHSPTPIDTFFRDRP